MIEDHFNQIPRITAPARQVFEEEFLLKEKPVIITDLFQNQPISNLTSMEDVGQKLKEVPIIIGEGFRPHIFASQTPNQDNALNNFPCTINQYLDLIDQEPKTFALCSENELPQPLWELLKFPEYCDFGSLQDDSIGRLFLGNAGNYAHLHFDGDFRHVLFYQAVGSKRIIIFPPDSAPKLAPHHHWSLVCMEHFTETEKDAFVTYAGGVQCILNPGETLFFPAAAWHYVEYTTTGMSVALRFGRNHYTKFMGDKLHKDSFLQRIASRMIDEKTVEEKYQNVYEMLKQAYIEPTNKLQEKIEKMSDVYQQAWSLMSNQDDLIYQIKVTELLNRSLLMGDINIYQHSVKPVTLLSGWEWLA